MKQAVNRGADSKLSGDGVAIDPAEEERIKTLILTAYIAQRDVIKNKNTDFIKQYKTLATSVTRPA